MIGGPWTRSMKGVHGPGPYFHGPGPWTRSMEGVHEPGVHVLYFPGFYCIIVRVKYGGEWNSIISFLQ